MPFTRPTLPQLVLDKQSDFATRFGTFLATNIRQNLRALAAVAGAGEDGLYSYLQFLSLQMFDQTAEAEYLELRAAEFGLYRKLPAAAFGSATLTGTNGTTLAAGTLLQRNDQAQFVTAAAATIVGTSASVDIVAALGGSAGNTPAGATLTIVTPVAGINSTVTVIDSGGGLGLVDGTDLETDDELRARLQQRRQQPPQGGAAPDWAARAATVPGVDAGNVWVYKRWTGAGNVGVTFVMSDRSIPNGGEVAAVQAALADPSWCPVIATPITFAPTAAPVTVTVHLDPDTSANRTAVTAALTALFAAEATPGGATLADGSTGGTLRLSHLWASAAGAVGTGDALIVSPVADIVAATGSLSTLLAVAFA